MIQTQSLKEPKTWDSPNPKQLKLDRTRDDPNLNDPREPEPETKPSWTESNLTWPNLKLTWPAWLPPLLDCHCYSVVSPPSQWQGLNSRINHCQKDSFNQLIYCRKKQRSLETIRLIKMWEPNHTLQMLIKHGWTRRKNHQNLIEGTSETKH